MTVGNAALVTFLRVLWVILDVIYWVVLIWVILSWVLLFASQSSFRWKHRSIYNTLMIINDFFTRATYPLLKPFRRLLPPHKTAGIDWSPLLLLLAIFAIKTFVSLLM
ncbi:MAG TPA: YggT family protein [Thermoanaerobaculia bacterium]|nr:YggT family protein [Thermoanaerobaculia bacterium]